MGRKTSNFESGGTPCFDPLYPLGTNHLLVDAAQHILAAGMRRWSQVRQQAVDDARRSVAHERVEVYAHAEVNRVRDAMANPPSSYQRAIDAVVPFVEKLVPSSAYDGQDLSGPELRATPDFIAAHLPPAKSDELSGRRVFVGEFGFGARLLEQLEPTRPWVAEASACGSRFVLFWQLANNEPGRRHYALILPDGSRTPCYMLLVITSKRALPSRRFLENLSPSAQRRRVRRARCADRAPHSDVMNPCRADGRTAAQVPRATRNASLLRERTWKNDQR